MQRLLQRLRLVPCATFRPHFIRSVLLQVHSRLKAGDFAAVDMKMAAMPAESLDTLIWQLSKMRDASRLADQWRRAAPHSRNAAVIAGYAEISAAWLVRGETYLQHVPLLRRRRFPEIMLRGQQQLLEVVSAEPGNEMALAGLIHCSVVIGAGSENRLNWLNQVMEVSPFHYPALRQYARGTLARWGGDEEERYRFANWVLESAPAGSCAHILVADTLIDDAFMATEEIEDIRLIARCIGNDERIEWLRSAILKWADANEGTLHERVTEILKVQGDNFHLVCVERFALAAFIVGAKKEARLLLTALRGGLQTDIWEDFVPPMPLWLHVIGSRRRAARRVHDLVCRDLALDPSVICQA